MEVLMLLFVCLIFLTSVMSSAKFRHRTEVLRIENMEASFAAEAVVDLMVFEVFKDGTCFLEEDTGPMETVLFFESDNGRDEVRIPVVLWSERDEQELCLYADVVYGERRASASAKLYYMEESEISGTWIVMERNGR